MTPEGEVGRFRRGESTGKPLGGNVADKPFPKLLYALARSRGFESQLGLARALGKRANSVAGKWYRGEVVPTPEEFGKLLILLKPTDEELEPLSAEYGVQLEAGRVNIKRGLGPEAALNVGRGLLKPSADPLGRWIEDIAGKRKITLREFSEKVGRRLDRQSREYSGLNTISRILEIAPQGLDLTPEETAELADVAASTIQLRVAQGHRFRRSSPGGLKRTQETLACRTYRDVEVANILGVSRERVRQLRQKFNLPMLMTDEHIYFLATRGKSGNKTNNSEVAEILGVSINTVWGLKGRRKWRGNLTPEQIKILENRPKPGRPRKEVGGHPMSERQDPPELTGTISLH